MHALAHQVRHPAHGQDVAGAVEGEGFIGIEPRSGEDFGMDRLKPPVVGLKSVRLESVVWALGRHPLDDIARTMRTAIPDERP